MQFKGVVFTGLGEGAGYVTKYNRYFTKEFGTEFFPGTLNLRTQEKVRLEKGVVVSPEETELCDVQCYPVRINSKIDGYIIVPKITRHGKDVVELLAKNDLRDTLRLKDGDKVTCELD